MTKDTSARARGRPRKPVVDGERPVVTLRLVPETRRRLEQAADANGWSLALEASSRLDQSFAEDAQLGSHVAMLTRAIGGLARLIEQSTGRSFLDDYVTFYAVQVAVNQALTAVAPAMPDNEATRYSSADFLDSQNMPRRDVGLC